MWRQYKGDLLATHSIHQIDQPTVRLLKEMNTFSALALRVIVTHTHTLKFSDSCCMSVTHVVLEPLWLSYTTLGMRHSFVLHDHEP